MIPPSEFDRGEPRKPVKAADQHSWPERCSALFEDLRRPARAMVARAYGRSLSDEEIDDVYSSAWTATLSALRNRGEAMSDVELRAYVLTAVASHASKELRRRSRKPTGLLSEAHEQLVADHSQPLPEERVIGSESQSIARDLLSSLPARRRAVMLLRYGWGLSPDEVCALITGLSRRAYRKEISRGVEELIARLGEVESGGWCRSREPLLRDYLAGTADEATRLQVEQHLRHCRACAELTARLRDEFHDLSGIAVLGAAAGLIAAPRLAILERLTNLAQAARDGAGAIAEKAELTVGAAAMSGGGRGAGVAGAGVAAKFTALGGAGKVALTCIGAGAAATACVAAGVIPGVTLDDLRVGGEGAVKRTQTVERVDPGPAMSGGGRRGGAPSATATAVAPQPPPQPDRTTGNPEPDAPQPPPGEFEPTAPAQPVVPASPAPQPVPAPPPSPSPASGGGGSIAGEEFGP